MLFFNDTATTEIYTLSLHDALPISGEGDISTCPSFASVCTSAVTLPLDTRSELESAPIVMPSGWRSIAARTSKRGRVADRKSTRLNSSHANISYAVFCLKKKNLKIAQTPHPDTILSNTYVQHLGT